MVRLCASPDTLAAYRASRPTVSAENAKLRAELAEAKAEISRLREVIAEQPDLGLTTTEARIYAALKKADRVMTASEIAAAASTYRRTISPGSVKEIIKRLRKAMAAAGEPWVIEGVTGGRWNGGGYWLAPREVTA